jgi:hypothetical protein
VRNRVLRGELTGRQVAGRWLVDLDSALRFQSQRGADAMTLESPR